MSLFLSMVLLTGYVQNINTVKSPENTILVLKQSSRKTSTQPHQQYVDLLRGFRAGLQEKSNKWHLEIVDVFDAAALAALDPDQFRFLVCLGTRPARLGQARFGEIPQIYSMVLNPSRHGLLELSSDKNQGIQGGIKARVAPVDYMEYLQKVHPQARTIGMLYANDVFASYAREIQVEAARRGLSVICPVVDNNRELVPKFELLLDQNIDLFLMLPDTEIFGKAYEFIFRRSMARKVPVMGPSVTYVNAGALWGVVLSPYDIGLQTAEMMEKALQGQRLSIEYPRQNKLTFNHLVAEKLEITFPEALVGPTGHKGRVVD